MGNLISAIKLINPYYWGSCSGANRNVYKTNAISNKSSIISNKLNTNTDKYFDDDGDLSLSLSDEDAHEYIDEYIEFGT